MRKLVMRVLSGLMGCAALCLIIADCSSTWAFIATKAGGLALIYLAGVLASKSDPSVLAEEI